MLPEEREMAHIRSKVIKQRIARKYNTKLITQKFKEGDLVRRIVEKHTYDGKLALNWDDPF